MSNPFEDTVSYPLTIKVPDDSYTPYSVEGRLHELDNSQSKLDALVGRLHSVLNPICLQDTPVSSNTPAESVPQMSTVATQIDSAVAHNYNMIFALERLLDRINL